MNPTPIEPHPNDREELARLLPELAEWDLPSDRQRRLQELVMQQIHQDHRAAGGTPTRMPRRALGRRLALATPVVAAGAVAAVLIATAGSGSGPGTGGSSALPGPAGPVTGLSPVAQVFEQAAVYASSRPFTPPRPDQWIYIKDRNLNPSSLARAKGQGPDVIYQSWISVDGKRAAAPNNGRLDTWNQRNDYPALSTMPADPKTVLARLRAQLLAPMAGSGRHRAAADGGPGGTPEEINSALFRKIAMILDEYLLPPAQTAALMRAAALIPGVTLAPGTVGVGGRRATAVGRAQEGGWLFEQLLLDPDTHEFIGYRSVAVRDHVIGAGGPGQIRVPKGEVQYVTTRLAAKIVDAAGRTR